MYLVLYKKSSMKHFDHKKFLKVIISVERARNITSKISLQILTNVAKYKVNKALFLRLIINSKRTLYGKERVMFIQVNGYSHP